MSWWTQRPRSQPSERHQWKRRHEAGSPRPDPYGPWAEPPPTSPRPELGRGTAETHEFGMQRELHTRLKEGPGILLIGQGYLRFESGTDPFLKDVLAKYGDGQGEERGYDALLE